MLQLLDPADLTLKFLRVDFASIFLRSSSFFRLSSSKKAMALLLLADMTTFLIIPGCEDLDNKDNTLVGKIQVFLRDRLLRSCLFEFVRKPRFVNQNRIETPSFTIYLKISQKLRVFELLLRK